MSPRADGNETRALLEELGVASATVFVGRVEHAINGGDPLSAWDLGELRASYEAFVDEFGPLLGRVDEGDVGAAEAMIARTRVMDVWRQFPNLDPELPEDVLPAGWPRRDAQAIFARVYDALGPLAEMRFQQILAEYEPALVKQAHYLTTKAASATTVAADATARSVRAGLGLVVDGARAER